MPNLPAGSPVQCPQCGSTRFAKLIEVYASFTLDGSHPRWSECPITSGGAICGNGHYIADLPSLIRQHQEKVYRSWQDACRLEKEKSEEAQKRRDEEWRQLEAKREAEVQEREDREEQARKEWVAEQNARLATVACENAQREVERRKACREQLHGVCERS